MVPTGRWLDKVRLAARLLVQHRRALAWGGLLWSVVVLLPTVTLFPNHGLNRPIVLALVALAPVAMAMAAIVDQPNLLLGVGLAAQLPALVACPDLLGSRTGGSVKGLAVAVLVMLFVASTFAPGGSRPRAVAESDRQLWRIFRWPEQWQTRATVILGAVWLAMAWLVVGDGALEESLRTARVAAAALCWMALAAMPLGRRSRPTERRDTAWSLLARRLVWAGLALGGWIWLRGVDGGVS